MNKINLILSDKTVFQGESPRTSGGVFLNTLGEVVFSTGMTGYVESLTDPSYSGQILVFTYPLIGNYGITPKETWESEKIHATGVVVSEATKEFADWLHEQGVPLLTGIDTRALTKHLRSRGTMRGSISPQPSLIDKRGSLPGRQVGKGEIVPFVSIPKPILYNAHHQQIIILVDCGMKMNILRELMKLPYAIKRVPREYDYSREDFAGVFLSNGPGDPADYTETISVLKKVLKKNIPVMGICLGSQIMGLAAGAKTYKLKFGHRGHNQPVQMDDGKCFITSQNHGYAVDESSLPRGWYVNFRNLNDHSVEGVAHKTKPFFSVQFHPEACPGPTDTRWLFKKFHELL